MKKFLLSVCALSFGLFAVYGAATDTRAEQTMEMSYSQGVITAMGFENQKEGGTGAAGFRMSPVDVAAYEGLKIKAVTVYSGAASNPLMNPDTDITLMIYNSESSTPVYTQDAEISSVAYASNVIPLTTPYLIKADEPLYICYKFKFSKRTQNWVCVDGKPNPDPMVGLCCVSEDDKLPAPGEWLSFGDSFNGALSMSVTLEGEEFPSDNAGILKVTPPTSSMVGDKPEFVVDLRNPGNNNIKNLEFKVEATDEQAYTKTIDFKPYFKKLTTKTLNIELEPFTTAGNKEVTLTLIKVNGIDNANKKNVGSASTACIGSAYSRMPVIEEGTGTWCGWCVAGIVMMEKIKEKYGDKVALIAAHQGDRMAVPSYQPFISKYTTGLPAAMFNRQEVIEVKPGLADDMIDNILSHSIFAKIDFGEFRMDENSNDDATFETFTEFEMDTKKQYCVSVAIVEDGLGPYTQKNYYSDELPNGSGPMDGWEDKPLEAPGVYYDDVARCLSSFPGEPLPEFEFEARKPIPYTVKVSGMQKIKGEKFRAIAMLTEEDTGYIINAAMKEFTNPGSSVNKIDSENINIRGGRGFIDVKGASHVEVYNISGLRTGLENLAPGMYIVRADGQVRKVMVH